VVASVVYAQAVVVKHPPDRRPAWLISPALMIAAVALLGLMLPTLRWYLVPAAPDLGHLLFFAGSSLELARNQYAR
jgi:hypothetical protein